MMHSFTVAHVVPLTIRLSHRPFLLFWCVLVLIALFKVPLFSYTAPPLSPRLCSLCVCLSDALQPYPTAADLATALCFLPYFYHLLHLVKFAFVIANSYLLFRFPVPLCPCSPLRDTGTCTSHFWLRFCGTRGWKLEWATRTSTTL